MPTKLASGNVSTYISMTKADWRTLQELRHSLHHTTTSETVRFLIQLGAEARFGDGNGAH